MTSTESRRTWSERLDPRNWSLVAKLAVVGLVPTVLALAIGAVRVVDQANVAEELSQGSGLVEAHQQVGALTQALQAERSAAVVFVGGNRLGDRNALDGAQTATDQAVRRTNDTLTVAEQQAPQLATAKRQAETTLGQLPIIRSQVGAAPTPASDITTRYTAAVQRVLALDRALLGQLQTSDTAGLATALGSTASAAEALELERSVLGGAIAASQLDEAQKAVVNGAEASYQAAASDYQAALTPQQLDQFGNFATDPANGARLTLRDSIMATPEGGRVGADPAAWNAAVDSSVGVVRSADRQAEEQFVGGRAQAAEQAGNTAGVSSVLLMLGLLLTIGIILLLGRQLVRSLRVLRTSALDVAERRLPQAVQGMRSGQAPSALVEPVPLESRDEIGEVARAFDAVHGQAIRLAADQAALQQNVNSMFVNLSRRSQALVERQLQLIEQLESNEQDPDQLSNLFQLDHLATRMRRNSENLLVLAGTDLAKRNVAPVQIVDVLRAAVSEVEQYQRVVVQTPPTATIAGRAANDVVHLLAELLDNATNFSPPDSQVVMSTTRTADASLLIEISDRGVGMADSELADANQRLGGPSEVDVSASRRMGLFVVGRLAARHRIGVRLSSASGVGRSGGLSASVTVPPQLVPSAAPVVEQPRDAGGTGEWGAVQGGARPAPPDRQTAYANGSAPGGSWASAVTGADGPVPPTTFGPGGAGGPSRNGSTPQLPTRTPGSALRQGPTGSSGSSGPSGSSDEQGAAPNGSTVRDITAFTPSGPGTDDGRGDNVADVFTPASDGPPSGGYGIPGAGPSDGAARDERWPSGGRDDRADGPARRGPGADDDRAGPTRPGDVTDESRTNGAADTTAPEDTGETTGDRADGTGRTVLGAAATAGVGGALAGVFGRRGEPDGPSTEEITPVEDDPAAEQDREAGDGSPDGDATDRPSGEAGDGTGDTVPAAAADGSDRVNTPAGTDRPEDHVDTELHVDAEETAGSGPGDLPMGTTAARVSPAAGQYDRGTENRPAADAHDPVRSDATGDHTAGDQTGDGARTASGDPASDEQGDDGPGTAADGARVAEPAGSTAAEVVEDDGSETETTAFPTVRPPREPMGGARPTPDRTGPLRPAPPRRPVMPGPTPSAPAAGPSPASGPRPPAGRQPVPRVPARSEHDELFAPAVPVEGDRGQLRRPGGLETARAGGGYDISQTTPIFEEIASAWFRSNRSVPVRWQDGAPDGQANEDTARGPDPAQPGSAPRPTPSPRPTPGRPDATGRAPEPAADAAPGALDDAGFASPADDVWRQAAVGAGDTAQSSEETTSAGLPKRRPRARLLPGSAAGSTVLSPPAASEARNAENVRGRLASYQQGVRQGRESRTTRTGSDIPEPSEGRQPAEPVGWGDHSDHDRPNTSEHEENNT